MRGEGGREGGRTFVPLRWKGKGGDEKVEGERRKLARLLPVPALHSSLLLLVQD